MTDLMIEREKTLCVTGHRNIKEKLNLNELKELFISYVYKGIDTFLVGMAFGFDTICFKVLQEIRDNDKKDIRIIACVPCPDQDKFFTLEQKEYYKKMLDSANEKVVLSDKYTPYCMMKRNRFMVDNSSVVVAYLRENKGGTFYTVNYAKEKCVELYFI